MAEWMNEWMNVQTNERTNDWVKKLETVSIKHDTTYMLDILILNAGSMLAQCRHLWEYCIENLSPACGPVSCVYIIKEYE